MMMLPTSGLSWLSLQLNSIDAISELATACLETDGGLPLGATDTYIQEH